MNTMLAWILIGGAAALILLLIWALLRVAAWADDQKDTWYPG